MAVWMSLIVTSRRLPMRSDANLRHLVVRAPVERAPTGLRHRPAPLLEEERGLVPAAGAADFVDPGLLDRAVLGSALAPDDDPVNAGEVELGDRSDERLAGKE